MIRLPDQPLLQSTTLGLTKSSNEGQLASMESALLEGESITSLGKAVSEVSDVFAQHLTRIQGIEDNRKVLEGKSQLASQFADHNIQLQSDFDPTSRMVKTKEFFDNYEKGMDLTDTSPIVQTKLKDYLLDVRTQGTINQAQDSLNLSNKRSLLATQNLVTAARRVGDIDAVRTAVTDNPSIMPEEGQRIIDEATYQINDEQTKADIIKNPDVYIEANKVKPDGISELQWLENLDMAEKEKVKQTNSLIDDAYTDIAETGKTSEQVRTVYAELPADERIKLEIYADSLKNGNLVRMQNDPTTQQALVGDTTKLLKDMQTMMTPGGASPTMLPGSPNNTNVDVRKEIAIIRANILSNLSRMPDNSASKLYLRGELDVLTDNLVRRAKNNAEVVIDDIKSEIDLGRTAPPEMMGLSNAIEADFLRDRPKLAKVGFDLKDSKVTKALDKMDAAKTISEKKAIFRSIYSKYVVEQGRVPVFADGVPSLEVATAQAIETGSDKIDYRSPAAGDAYLRDDAKSNARLGKYTIAMFEYQEQNPNATVKDLREEYKRLKANDARNDAKKSK